MHSMCMVASFSGFPACFRSLSFLCFISSSNCVISQTKLGRVAPEEPKKHWSERHPPEWWSRTVPDKEPAPTVAEHVGEKKGEEVEEEDEEEYAHIPIWKRALMKKKDKEQRMKVELEKSHVSLCDCCCPATPDLPHA